MLDVCQSQETNCTWKFDSVNGMYILKDGNERTIARINGKYLYDPEENPNTTLQVQDLWNHWKTVKDNYSNE